MRRLSKVTKLISILLFGALLLICSVGINPDHTSSANQPKASCSSSCHTHGQAAAITGQQNKDEDDDKEPTPPAFGWPYTEINLALLYLAPVLGVLWFVSNKQKILLTTQLRF